jgi:hypothetical protein
MLRPRYQRKGKRQRFYARNALKTTLDCAFGRLMRSFLGHDANLCNPAQIHPVLTGLADECCGMLARLVAYVGALALLAIVGIHLWDELPAAEAVGPSAKADWSVATHSHPAFAVSQFDLAEKTETYDILRYPEGGRKDILRWAAPDGRQGATPVAELEIYRPGGESSESGPVADITARMDPDGLRELETAGIIDSKFGSVTLLRVAGQAGSGRSCLGFIKLLDEPKLRISGWSCRGDGLPARRTAIGCILSRLLCSRRETIQNWLNYSPTPSSSGAVAPLQPPRPDRRIG